MKTIASLIAAGFFVLFVLTVLVPYAPAQDEARSAGFDDATVDVGLQYSFERRLLSWPTRVLELVLVCCFALTTWGRKFADLLLTWTGGRRIPAALLLGLAYLLAHECYALPMGLLRLEHAHYRGMSNLSVVDWFRERYLGFAIGLVWEAIVLVGFYALLIWLPRTWWLLAPIGLSALGIAYAFLAPIWINPLFNDFTPLAQTKWKDQESKVRALIDKANVPVGDILVMNASRQSNHTNAYFTGFGSTRRIVLYDTLLDNHTEAEIESVLAHELGHWRHDHIVKGIFLGWIAGTFGCFLLHWLLCVAQGRTPWQLQSLADPAGLPLIILAVNLGSWAALPVGNAVSRYFERQADEASLELAGQPEAFIKTEIKMAKVNKANVAPTPWNVWIFASHPPTVERIRMARDWQRNLRER